MGIIDYDEIWQVASESGILATPRVLGGLMLLHNMVAEADLDPDSVETYKTILATISVLKSLTKHTVDMDTAAEWLAHCALSAYGDIAHG